MSSLLDPELFLKQRQQQQQNQHNFPDPDDLLKPARNKPPDFPDPEKLLERQTKPAQSKTVDPTELMLEAAALKAGGDARRHDAPKVLRDPPVAKKDPLPNAAEVFALAPGVKKTQQLDPDELLSMFSQAKPSSKSASFPDPTNLPPARVTAVGEKSVTGVGIEKPQTNQPSFEVPPGILATNAASKPGEGSSAKRVTFMEPTDVPSKSKPDSSANPDVARPPKLPNLRISFDKTMGGTKAPPSADPQQGPEEDRKTKTLPDPSIVDMLNQSMKRTETKSDPSVKENASALLDPELLLLHKSGTAEASKVAPSEPKIPLEIKTATIPEPQSKVAPSDLTASAVPKAAVKVALPDPSELRKNIIKAPEPELKVLQEKEQPSGVKTSGDNIIPEKMALFPDPPNGIEFNAPKLSEEKIGSSNTVTAKTTLPDPSELLKRKKPSTVETLPSDPVKLKDEASLVIQSSPEKNDGAATVTSDTLTSKRVFPDPPLHPVVPPVANDVIRPTEGSKTAKDALPDPELVTKRESIVPGNIAVKVQDTTAPDKNDEPEKGPTKTVTVGGTPEAKAQRLPDPPMPQPAEVKSSKAKLVLPDPSELLKKRNLNSTEPVTVLPTKAPEPVKLVVQEKMSDATKDVKIDNFPIGKDAQSDTKTVADQKSLTIQSARDADNPLPQAKSPVDSLEQTAKSKTDFNSSLTAQATAAKEEPPKLTVAKTFGATETSKKSASPSEAVPRPTNEAKSTVKFDQPVETKTTSESLKSHTGQQPETMTEKSVRILDSAGSKSPGAPAVESKKLLPDTLSADSTKHFQSQCSDGDEQDEEEQPGLNRTAPPPPPQQTPRRYQPATAPSRYTLQPQSRQQQPQQPRASAQALGPLPSYSTSSRDLIVKMRANLAGYQQSPSTISFDAESDAMDPPAIQIVTSEWENRGNSVTVFAPSFGSTPPVFRPPHQSQPLQQTQLPQMEIPAAATSGIAQEVRTRLAVQRATREADAELKQELQWRQMEIDRMTQSLDRLNRQNQQTKAYLVAAVEKGDNQAAELMQVMEEDRAMLRATRQENLELKSRVESDSRDIAGMENRLSGLEQQLQTVQQENRRLEQLLRETAARIDWQQQQQPQHHQEPESVELWRLRRDLSNQRLKADITGGRPKVSNAPQQQQLNQQMSQMQQQQSNQAGTPMTRLQRALQFQLPKTQPPQQYQQPQQQSQTPPSALFLPGGLARQQRGLLQASDVLMRHTPPNRAFTSSASVSSIFQGYEALDSFRSRSGDDNYLANKERPADRGLSGTLQDYATAKELGASARRYADELLAKYASELQQSKK